MSQKWTCKVIWLITKHIQGNIVHIKLDDKEVQMHITKVGHLEISKKEIGGDLNRLEPTKIKNFKEEMAT